MTLKFNISKLIHCTLLTSSTVYIETYNPPINFRVILLATLRHVV